MTRSLTMRRLEWLGIVLPLVFLVLYHYLVAGPAHGLLHTGRGLAVLVVSLGLAITVFSRWVFWTVARLQSSRKELSRVVASQNAQLRALNDANLGLSEERLVSSVLQRVVDLSRGLAAARYAALGVLGEDGRLSSFLTSGISQAVRADMGHPPTGRGLLGVMLERAGPLRLASVSDHSSFTGFPPGHPAMTSFLGVPIRYKGRGVGSLYLTEKLDGTPFSAEDEEVVHLFANQAAVAIQNARLYEQIQALAVETERTRISREMHDGLAQILSYVNTKAQAVETYLANGEIAVAQEQLGEISEAARQVYRDIREGILALRTQVGSGQRLADVLG